MNICDICAKPIEKVDVVHVGLRLLDQQQLISPEETNLFICEWDLCQKCKFEIGITPDLILKNILPAQVDRQYMPINPFLKMIKNLFIKEVAK